MQKRKELSEKSKKLIAKQFNSDILNKSSGYYKQEKIYPITSKPNELKINIEKFIPHFKEEKAVERHFNNLLSDKQRNNSFVLKYKKLLPNKNQELEIIRKRNKTIKDNCLDKEGNFSCRRRYILEFYGIDKLNNSFDYNDVNNNINIIKDDVRDISKDKEKDYKDKENKKPKINNLKRHKNKVKEFILKSRNLDDYNGENYNNNNENDSTINNNNYEERFKTVNVMNKNNNIENNSFFNNFNNEKQYDKISRNKDQLDNQYNNILSYKNKEMVNKTTTNNTTNPQKKYNRLKTDIHYPGAYFNTTQNNITNRPKNFLHAKDISKIFYTKSNNPVKNTRIKKNEITKEDKEHYNLEFSFQNKNIKDNDISLLDSLSKKNIKEIFYRNGLHIYDINEDDMNLLSIEKKMEAKLRKKRNDENFENNYKKAINILEKKGIKVDKEQISNEQGYKSKNIIIQKKRRCTPGKVLYDNRFHKDENTKLNTGNNNFKRKSKNILPQYDINYKNNYKYKQKQLKK